MWIYNKGTYNKGTYNKGTYNKGTMNQFMINLDYAERISVLDDSVVIRLNDSQYVIETGETGDKLASKIMQFMNNGYECIQL